MNHDLIISETAETLAHDVAKYFYLWASEKINSGADFYVALSGGNTPKLFFKALASGYSKKNEWEKVHFFWSDERCVEPTENESNYLQAKLALLDNINIPQQNIHRIIGENTPENEAKRYAEEINCTVPIVGTFPKFDLVMLGLGDDGHTASLFPDQLHLLENENICVTAKHPVSGQNRISLSLKTINHSEKVIFVVSGESKSKKVSEIIKKEAVAVNYPAFYVKPLSGLLYWFLDKDAIAELIGLNINDCE